MDHTIFSLDLVITSYPQSTTDQKLAQLKYRIWNEVHFDVYGSTY